MADDSDTSELIHNITICLIAAATAGVIVTIYHCFATSHVRAILRIGNRGVNNNTPGQPRTAFMQHQQDQEATQSSIENSIVTLIPSHKYEKKGDEDSIGDGDNDVGMCAVCLSEFVVGEEIRTLPECAHSFHVACIDMWLFSHSNCPMCRTIATPSPRNLLHLLDYHSEGRGTNEDGGRNISPSSSLHELAVVMRGL